ncbi:MAG: ATP synthase F1 subunit delta [Planctomycetes bacterium]|nr:ATP synthase F1 subunit delta [Planctomycetota bacterium]
MLSPAVTRRYAEALLDAARDAKQVETVESDLALAARAATTGKAIAQLLNPAADRKSLRSGFVEPLSQQLKTRLVKNTVSLLIDRKRGAVLFHLAAVYHRLALESRGEAEGIIESATALSPQELRSAEEAISGRVRRKVTLTPHVDPSLMGGVRVTVGSRRFDATVRSRLEELRGRMLAAQL